MKTTSPDRTNESQASTSLELSPSAGGQPEATCKEARRIKTLTCSLPNPSSDLPSWEFSRSWRTGKPHDVAGQVSPWASSKREKGGMERGDSWFSQHPRGSRFSHHC